VQAAAALLRGEAPAKPANGAGSGAQDDGQGAGSGAQGDGLDDGEGAGSGTQGDGLDDGEGAGSGTQGDGLDDGQGDGLDDGQGDGLGDGDGATGPVTVAELAKALGTKPGALMDDLQVEVDLVGEDGAKVVQSVTLGDLRRGYIGAETLRKERESFEQTSEAKGLEFMRTRADLESLGAAILPHVPQQVQAEFAAWQHKQIERERTLAHEAIPEWRDPSKFQADRGMMIEHLKPWGFTAADVYAIGDHRIAKYVRDNARKAQRAAEAEQRARNAGKPKPGQGPAPGVKQSALRQRLANIVQTGRAAKTEAEKTAAVGALLRTTGAIK